MKISISNLAWDQNEDIVVAKVLRDYDVGALDLAPTKVWKLPLKVSDVKLAEFKNFWQKNGQMIVSAQSVLYSRPELNIFSPSPKIKKEIFRYLSSMLNLTAKLGAKILVFGSPRNKRLNGLSSLAATKIAVDFFSRLGNVAKKENVFFCLEPNPREYNADFITNTSEAISLLQKINHSHVRLNMDTGAMFYNHEDYQKIIEKGFPFLSHFHVSEPNFVTPSEKFLDHKKIARILRSLNYQNYVSVEMIPKEKQGHLEKIRQALSLVLEIYG